MLLNTPEDYERLGEHLNQVDGVLATFANRHKYTVYPPLHGGRYPNRRMTLQDHVLRSIHIIMDDAPNGERYDQFFPEIPYTIWGGAWIDDHKQKIRWLGPSISVQGIPFSVLVGNLEIHLNHFHTYLASVTEDYIKACARTIALASCPN
jgi:hypothetical protein